MRVLSLCRLFSGLAECLERGVWQPSGVPAIDKVLQGLAADPGTQPLTLFAVKDAPLAKRFPIRRDLSLPEIGPACILPWRSVGERRLSLLATEADHALAALAAVRRFRPDVVYATYAHIVPAALIARLGLAPVVLRMMGIFPHHRALAKGGLSPYRALLRAPFAHVICTEDGSDPSAVLPHLLAPGVPSSVLLNGVDRPSVDRAEVTALKAAHGLGSRPVVLYVGRLEPYKGCLDFVHAALAMLKRDPACADFVLIGDGPCRAELDAMRQQAGAAADRIHLVGAVPSRQVPAWQKAADVYVSLNRNGNLSNANLEALAMGTCVLIPSADAAANIDSSTACLLPPDVVLRYDRHSVVDSLSATLSELLTDPARMVGLGQAAGKLAEGLVRPWPERVAREIAILKNVCQGQG